MFSGAYVFRAEHELSPVSAETVLLKVFEQNADVGKWLTAADGTAGRDPVLFSDVDPFWAQNQDTDLCVKCNLFDSPAVAAPLSHAGAQAQREQTDAELARTLWYSESLVVPRFELGSSHLLASISKAGAVYSRIFGHALESPYSYRLAVSFASKFVVEIYYHFRLHGGKALLLVLRIFKEGPVGATHVLLNTRRSALDMHEIAVPKVEDVERCTEGTINQPVCMHCVLHLQACACVPTAKTAPPAGLSNSAWFDWAREQLSLRSASLELRLSRYARKASQRELALYAHMYCRVRSGREQYGSSLHMFENNIGGQGYRSEHLATELRLDSFKKYRCYLVELLHDKIGKYASVVQSLKKLPQMHPNMEIMMDIDSMKNSDDPEAEDIVSSDGGDLNDDDLTCRECGATFCRKGNMLRHVRTIHREIRKYGCESCDRKFSSKWHLGKHIRVVHEQMYEFRCAFCDRRFSTQYNCNHHMSTRHRGREVDAASEQGM
ncbi:MDS1 and EVI1 complex locus protein EVI1 [Porphyridium purpureum]|uniref:MDS1 and EVI1 complex locus protein EVI1 n=1 Tax=Porphyridium purpureum TaxID=35688 RepID=A0A5J4ZA63_PORPP|nr:MDS1 and EVI1 complex locus protein EVI1 [Porphyridium purpureum]|eukprot:POR4817..scf295_1